MFNVTCSCTSGNRNLNIYRFELHVSKTNRTPIKSVIWFLLVFRACNKRKYSSANMKLLSALCFTAIFTNETMYKLNKYGRRR